MSTLRASSIALGLALASCVAGCTSTKQLLQASNDRDWEPIYAVLPTAEVQGDRVTLKNVRYCKYVDPESYVPDYYDTQFDVSQIQGVDFIVMPFEGMPALAHTLVSFAVVAPPAKPQYVAVSVETRKERGERYSGVKGTTNQYELTYVVADERDVLVAQVQKRQPVYLYHSIATPEVAQQMFLDITKRVNQLASEPEWYNTLTNNCTTNIFDHINRIKPQRVVYDYRVLLPGLSDKLAFEQGLIERNGNFAETRERARINDKVERWADHPDFSLLIRQ